MSKNSWRDAALACALCAAGLAQANTGAIPEGRLPPGRQLLTQAVTEYLQDHGDLCVGKFTWPRYVTAADRQTRTNDAVQLPVLERLGLVTADVVQSVPSTGAHPVAFSAAAGQPASSGSATRYSLTAEGRHFYLRKHRTVLGAHDNPVQLAADFCVGHLSLERVVKWTAPAPAHGHLESVVWYTYRIKAAAWMADPAARQAFPVIDSIIHGQGHLLMSATVRADHGNWMAVLPGQ